MRRLSLAVILSGLSLCLVQPCGIFAQQASQDAAEAALPAGHSQHGEAFNEGPRQAAYLMDGTGPIQFDVTSAHPDVQKFVEQGIGQLHGFWYFEAERSFRQAAMLDPDCAICYWGMAMANANNSKRAKEFLEHAKHLRGHATEREAMYIDALDDKLNGTGDKKEKAKRQISLYQAIADRYPDDLEAKAWLGYALYKHRSDADKKYEEVDAALKEVLAVEPLHPVHHYLIHLWDIKDASQALASAARCGAAAPNIAHMWHMPGHIYSRLKRYEDAAWQQEASARTDHANMMRDRVLPDAIHNFAHNNEWLIRDLIYVGRWRDAAELAKNMIELPRHPKYNTLSRRSSTYYGRVRLFDVLKRYERWGELAALTDSPYLEPTGDETEQVRRLSHRGIALAHLHHVDKVDEIIADLSARLEKERAKEAEEKRKQDEDDEQAKKEGKKPPKRKKRNGESSVERLEKAIAGIQGRLAAEYGEYQKALRLLKKADEDKVYIARVQLQAGEKEAALKAIADEVKSRENQVHTLAVQTEMLWLAGEREQAKAALKRLRALSGSIQLGAAPFDRITPIAVELGFPEDWRLARTPAEDFGQRPQLDALGPFRWSPSPAPDWTLKDHTGKQHALAQYKGRPLIVIFYLGFGCLHCAEQLHAFAPLTEKFKQAGISLVAISSDDAEGLKISLKNYEGGMPFPLLSNEALDVFKAYRAYDDFEQTPLHGTLLIDGDGRVLWQDIGYEPFMDANFVLEESRRLLNQSSPLPQPLAMVALPQRSPPPAVSQQKLARIDPVGIGGSLVLAGTDLPEAALETFYQLAHGEASQVVVLAMDNADATKATTQRLLKRFNDSRAAELRIVRLDSEDRIAAQDWPAVLATATGVWIAGANAQRAAALGKAEAARRALAKFVADGNVVGVAGPCGAMLAETAFPDQKSPASGQVALALLPDAIIDTHATAQDSPSRLVKVLQQQPHLIGYELDAGAAMVVRGRRIWKVGQGAVRIQRQGGAGEEPVQIALADERDAADLTALRRAARDAMAGNVAPKKPQAARVESGTLILIGGGGMPKGIVTRFVELAGGRDAHIVVLPTALPDPIPEGDGIAEEFRTAGAKSVTVLPGRTLDKVESEEYLGALKQATGIWFGGGRQWRFVDAYLDTKAQHMMHDVLRRGGVIMGSSAGASIQAGYLARGNPLGNVDIMAAGYERGLGFLPGAAVDQHFTQRKREADMLSLVRRYPQILGIGIDESTALIISGEIGEVAGRGDVHIYDASADAESPAHHAVAAGERFNLVKKALIVEQLNPRMTTPMPPAP